MNHFEGLVLRCRDTGKVYVFNQEELTKACADFVLNKHIKPDKEKSDHYQHTGER